MAYQNPRKEVIVHRPQTNAIAKLTVLFAHEGTIGDRMIRWQANWRVKVTTEIKKLTTFLIEEKTLFAHSLDFRNTRLSLQA